MTAKPRCATPAALDRLRVAARRLGPPPEAHADVTDYDWSRPHRFTVAEHRRLGGFARRLQQGLGTALAHVLRTGAGLAVEGPEECYPSAVEADAACYVPIRDAGGQPCGAFRFPTPLAAAWVERLLGGTPSARTGGAGLSALEAGLLLDIASWMVKAVSETASHAGTPEIQHEPTVTGWAEALPTDDATELCRFVFREVDAAAGDANRPDRPAESDDAPGEADVDTSPEADVDTSPEADADEATDESSSAEAAGAESTAPAGEGGTEAPPSAALLLTSRFLQPLAEADPAARPAAIDPETFSRRLHARLEMVPVTVRARLGAASIPLGDFLGLETGDVVLLDRDRGEPIDLTVDGQVILRARPATSAGQYAVEIQDLRRHPRLELAT